MKAIKKLSLIFFDVKKKYDDVNADLLKFNLKFIPTRHSKKSLHNQINK